MFASDEKPPRSIDVLEVMGYISMGRSNRARMRKSDPYANEKDSDLAIRRDAAIIVQQYNERSREKGTTDDKRRVMYKDIMMIQFGHDPIPRVGDFYQDHTVTDVIHTEGRIEIYGVLGTIPKRERERIIADAATIDCLRDKVRRRGYRFCVLQSL